MVSDDHEITVMYDAADYHIQFVVDGGTNWRTSSVIQFYNDNSPQARGNYNQIEWDEKPLNII